MIKIDVKKYSETLGRGLVISLAPSMLKGALLEVFEEKNLNVEKATEWVLSKNSLWNDLGIEKQNQFKHLARKVGDMSWLDADWVITAVKGEYPAVASLFLGWEEANDWLVNQIEDIKKHLET